MTIRNIYIPREDKIGVIAKKVDFKWYPGLSISQKQKSIASLHLSAKNMGFFPLLEVSTKSTEVLGTQLSAFNLKFFLKNAKIVSTIESVFQGSKVFERGGPYTDLYYKKSIDAKKDIRLKNSGNIEAFLLEGEYFETMPRTLFYDWIYISALAQNKNLLTDIVKYKGFSDIEFNDVKSINCQAYSVALCVSLIKHNKLEEALLSPKHFLDVLQDEYNCKNRNVMIQGTLL